MIGIDLVKVERIKDAVKNERFLQRVFSQNEIAYAFSKNNPNQCLAGIFAAKEAVVKVLGGNIFEVEILHKQNGKPYAVAGEKQLEVSISHDGDYAIAVAISLT